MVRIRVGVSERDLEDELLKSFFLFVQRKDIPLREMIKIVLLKAPHRSPPDRAAQILSEFLIESEKSGETLYLNDAPYETYLRERHLVEKALTTTEKSR